MPVNVLYCEGGKNSPDIRVLRNVLSGVRCEIKYGGSKSGLDRKILFLREERPNPIVAAIKDRDFDEEEISPIDSPKDWTVRENEKLIQVGWSWERKEIENYLIDPRVVSRSLRKKAPPIEEYQTALEESARTIADYTAARTALSISSPRQKISVLKNYWGNEIVKNHRFPDRLSDVDCRSGIRDILSQYEQDREIREEEVLERFDRLQESCRDGGLRFQNFLTFFSGKDLLCAMESALIGWGFEKPSYFQERIVKGIENSPEDIGSWLPEWERLRQAIQDFNP